jgi:DNA-binding NarL/FixJ family response regulator
MSRAPLRVIVVDDHDLFRAGLAAILNTADGIEVVGQAAGGRRATILADELAPDVVLMDINMPDMNGIDATRDILRRHPDMAIAMLSMFADAGAGARATAAGSCSRARPAKRSCSWCDRSAIVIQRRRTR